MIYKGILLDIDNTLYDYSKAHEFSRDKVLDLCINEFNIEKKIIIGAYNKARKRVNIELSETASSHNRLLYFQKMMEILQLNSLENSMRLYNVYWDNFLDKMTPYDDIYKLLEKYKYRICLVTDLTAHIQYRKIQKLNLDKYCNCIVTSEEAGKEKPHPYMFMMALTKLNLNPEDVCMIGDSFKKDIFGATNLGIKSIWLNHENKKENYDSELVQEVKIFKEILELV